MAKIRNKEIIKLWKQGKTMQSIGEEFNISKQRVHQIIFRQIYYEKGYPKNLLGTIPKALRDKVFSRENFQCRKCKDRIQSHLTINHIVPRIVGGKNELKNLEVLCFKCNRQAFAKLVRKALKFYFEKIQPPYRKEGKMTFEFQNRNYSKLEKDKEIQKATKNKVRMIVYREKKKLEKASQ